MANNENLKKGNPDTEFKSGREQVETAKKGGLQLGINNKARKLYIDQLEIVIKLGKEKTLKAAKKAGDQDIIKMIEEGGLIAFEHLAIVMDRKIKPETRLKALDMIIDRQEGKAVAKTENKEVREFGDEVEYID